MNQKTSNAKKLWRKLFQKSCFGNWDCNINPDNPYFKNSKESKDCEYRKKCEDLYLELTKDVSCPNCNSKYYIRKEISGTIENLRCTKCKKLYPISRKGW